MKNNTMKIAVCGKGGVGKTAFITILSKILSTHQETGRLLIIDADPAIGLPTTLGIKTDKSIAQVRESILEAAKRGDVTEENELAGSLDYMLTEAIVEMPEYAFLAMGRTDSKGCYCSLNEILHLALGVLTKNFDTILIDGEAGLEQINRQVTRELDILIALTDVSTRGRETLAHIAKLVKDEKVIDCKRVGVVINRVPDGADIAPIKKFISDIGLEVFGTIPMDRTLEKFDMDGRPLNALSGDDHAFLAVCDIVSNIGL